MKVPRILPLPVALTGDTRGASTGREGSCPRPHVGDNRARGGGGTACRAACLVQRPHRRQHRGSPRQTTVPVLDDDMFREMQKPRLASSAAPKRPRAAATLAHHGPRSPRSVSGACGYRFLSQLLQAETSFPKETLSSLSTGIMVTRIFISAYGTALGPGESKRRCCL